MEFGYGNFIYEWVEDWGIQAKERWNIVEAAGVTVDREDRVYVLTRTVPPVVVFDRAGRVLDAWGDDIFVRAHGMYLDSEGYIYGVDDGGHAVYKFDQSHNLVMTLGEKGKPSDTGCVNKDYRTVAHGAGPFNYPTRLVAGKDGYIYVSDGYGNSRVHKFDRDGRLITSWGEPGEGPGQFNLPHGIALGPNSLLYVADRQNHRVQIFTTDGIFVSSWKGLHRPSDIWIDASGIVYVAECKRTSDFGAAPSRISIMDLDGKLLSRLDGDAPYTPELGSRCAHGIAVDSEGSLYITEVAKKAKGSFFGVKKYRRL